jgi:hypothetical protein
VGACLAGETSEYRRQLGSAVDMPLDADVFRAPPGRNAPQQVTRCTLHCMFFSASRKEGIDTR